ncbi:MAG: hypothetical protein AB9919_14835 [Geobacteraceae bacterium]
MENREGRASTAIVSFDPKSRICVTRSGRRYHLFGPSGFDADGDYVWRIWSRGIPTINISDEFEIPKINRDGLSEVLEKIVGSMLHGWPYQALDPIIRYSPEFGWCLCGSEDARSKDAMDIDIRLLTRLIYDDFGEGSTGEALACRISDEWIQEKLLSKKWPRLKDLPPYERDAFDEWLKGRTVPAIEGLPPEEQDAYYPWDYALWKNCRTRDRI